MFCRNFIIYIFFAIVSVNASAQKQNADEQKAAEELKNKNFSGKQNLEWEKIQTKLGALKGKLDSQENVVKAMLSEKNSLAGEDQQKRLELLKEEHARYKKMLEEYNELNNEFLTKFPEKGIKELRLYSRQKSKTLESLGREITVQERAEILHEKIMKQYPSTNRIKGKGSNKDSDSSNTKTETKSKTEESEAKAVSRDVTDSILFSK